MQVNFLSEWVIPGLTWGEKIIGKSSQNSPIIVLLFGVVQHVYFVCIYRVYVITKNG